MSTREQFIQRADDVIYDDITDVPDLAQAVVDALLPQVFTIEELKSLPQGTKLLDAEGEVWSLQPDGFARNGWPYLKGTSGAHNHYGLEALLPLTVVWQP